ncbi:MAG: isoprenylcysteine carboxylmethyltransferase family protein [Atopobiaceae bacterium]|nr:isoprenylcysteine carboxylmethyltransferase family protein [Atopobiaceae bacterium]MBQ6649866.1 isoprenylcysteine carboxylmethyltransferase family protein [Atopobiaceae bacterium]
MRIVRDIAGYLMGLMLFVALVPAIMWWVAGGAHPTTPRLVVFAVIAVTGIGLSVWSIVYMRLVGRGNPMDAFNHEVAPRTSALMTEGPYRICRNPMLLGVLVYYLGVVVLLASPKAALVFVAYCLIMAVQVRAEEARLERDFGEEYRQYCAHTKRLIPFVW